MGSESGRERRSELRALCEEFLRQESGSLRAALADIRGAFVISGRIDPKN